MAASSEWRSQGQVSGPPQQEPGGACLRSDSIRAEPERRVVGNWLARECSQEKKSAKQDRAGKASQGQRWFQLTPAFADPTSSPAGAQ